MRHGEAYQKRKNSVEKLTVSRLLMAAAPLTFIVVVAGAFVRLSDAGLGCPDWPGCYGQLLGVADSATAAAHYPDSPYDLKKAWIEVGHRYIAGLLGLLVAFVAVADFLRRRRFGLPQIVLLLIVGQALLGMLTVTEKLHPPIVSAHLLGGLLILSLITAALPFRPLSAHLTDERCRQLRKWWGLAVTVAVVQITLGGWVSTNYAGIACPNFPLCHGDWLPPTVDFSGFVSVPSSAAELTTIHWMHRVGALLLTVALLPMLVSLWREGAHREVAVTAGILLAQITLGIVNVVWQLPLWAAVTHNAGAALLIMSLVALGVKLQKEGGRPA